MHKAVLPEIIVITYSNLHVLSLFPKPCNRQGLLGIAPSGGITFLSQPYDESISDQEIIQELGNLDKRFWQPNDSVMRHQDFIIDELIKS